MDSQKSTFSKPAARGQRIVTGTSPDRDGFGKREESVTGNRKFNGGPTDISHSITNSSVVKK